MINTYHLMGENIFCKKWCTLLLALIFFDTSTSYLLLVDENLVAESVIFNASLHHLKSHRVYEIDNKRSAPFVESLITIDEKNGQVSLLQQVRCDALFYPNLFTVFINSFSSRLKDVEYYSIPLRIFITGKECTDHREENMEHLDEVLNRERRSLTFTNNIWNPFSHVHPSIKEKINKAKEWVSETYASYGIPSAGKWKKICLKQSQFISSLTSFLPETIVKYCKVNFQYVSDERFKIEHSQGDLVASKDVCIVEPMWKVTVSFITHCKEVTILNNEHRLKIVYHHQKFNDTDIAKRVRRELRNQSPFFEQHLYVASVLEECEPPVIVTTVKARDPEGNPIQYSMTSLLDSRTQGMFEIDATTGVVTTKVQLDRELVDVHYFRVTALDNSFPPRSGTTMLQINVLDVNDHAPVFEMNEYEASVRESVSVGTAVITLKATDQDYGKNSDVEYSIQSINGGGISSEEADNQAFKIDAKSGAITTRTLLDRESTEVYTLIIQATDQASPQTARKSATASLIVNILDDNDNYPQFSERTYTVNLNEDMNANDNPVVAHIRASDADQGANAVIRYTIVSGNTQNQFAIDSLSGDVSLVKPLDYESLRNFRLVIRAQDGGSPSKSNTTQLLVNVRDVNDNQPRFYTTLFQESVLENVPVGYSIVKVQAFDHDEGSNADIKYTISPRDSTGGNSEDLPLSVDSHSGWIFTTRELDREDQAKFMFQVVATDKGVPPLSASASVIITIQDVNDNNPMFEPKIYESMVSEDDSPGTPVATVTATDADEDKRLHYELTNGNVRGRFSITSQNGQGVITVAQPLDYKQEKKYILTVTATDSGGRTDTATVYVNVTDANNFAPVFENAPYSGSVYEDAPVGSTVLVVSASDNDVGVNAQITYTLGDDPSGNSAFSINPQTGAIVTSKPLDREVTSGYLLTVTATDGGNPSMSDTTDVEITILDINDNYPVFKQAAYSGSVAEDALVGTSVVQVAAVDSDVGLNGRIRYTLSDKDLEDGSFVIDPTSGVIRTNKGIDRESVAYYELEAYAIDRGTPTLSSSVPVTIKIEDINDSPPAFASDHIVLYIPENSPIGSTVGEIYAKDPDEGVNAIVQYTIIGGEDSQSFSLMTRVGSDKAELITMIELDYESPKKKYDLIIRAASPPLRSDAHVEVIVTDVNDNAPVLKDFHVVFNNYKDFFPTGPIGKVPAYDADVSDKLVFKVLSGNNANLIALNESTGQLTLSPQLNTNVPKLASMEIFVTDGVNEVKAVMQLTVRLVTEEMLYNSITMQLNQMTKEAFLSPLLSYFIDGLAAIIPCPKDNIYVFSIHDDTNVNKKILNVSFSVKRPDLPKESYYSPQFLQEKVYLNRAILTRLSTVQILPFIDNLCVREPCLNFEECITVLKFANASGFIHSDTVLFRPIYPVTTFTCQCPMGFTGSREHYLCDTEVNLCYSSPCKNKGTCKLKEGGYTCICPSNFTGANCEIALQKEYCQSNLCAKEISCGSFKNKRGGVVCEDCTSSSETDFYTPFCELKSRSFNKGSFLTFPSLKQRHRMHLRIKFATRNQNGLLLYNGRYNEQHDFVDLQIVNRNLQFQFSLGGPVSKVTVSIPGGVSDGKWHTAIVNYFNKSVTLSIDDCDTALALKHGKELGNKWSCAAYIEHNLESRCASLTETCYRFLDLTGPLQLGGLPAFSKIHIENHNFEGCISDFFIDHKMVDLNSFVTDNGTVAGCPEKKYFCSSQPCKNGGTCTDGWASYKCACPPSYGGKDCGQSIGTSWHFTGDGMMSFNPLLRPIQLPWLNALSVRTIQEDTFLLSVQVGQNSSAVMALRKGFLEYTFNGDTIPLNAIYLSDGEWHNVEVTWIGTEIRLAIDYGEYSILVPFSEKIQGMYVGKILVGGPDNSYNSLNAGYNYLEGCIQDIRIGNHQTTLNRPTVKENVEEGCFPLEECQNECPVSSWCKVSWGRSQCICNDGYVGDDCAPVCSLNPCENGANCKETNDLVKGYDCVCNSTEYSGEYCEIKQTQPCPSSWWGYPVCGPCNCDVDAGYNPDCDKNTGKCHCRENHYQPKGSTECIPCDCYHLGSTNIQCDRETGKCKCKDGVIGQKCDSCPNSYAEITLKGCEVIYDGCPRSSASSIWWPRTLFEMEAIEVCPKGSHGKASRKCDNDMGGWQEPDLFNCTSDSFIDLRHELANIESGELTLNTFVVVKLAHDLYKAANTTKELYGSDVLITYDLIKKLLRYESNVHGLNLTHSQDKDYIYNVVHSASVILTAKYANHWRRIKILTGQDAEHLINLLEAYINVLLESQHDTYTSPFEIVSPNVVLGLDIVTPESLYGYEPDLMSLGHGSNSFTTESVILPDTSLFLQDNKILQSQGPMVAFPKYNNYLLDRSKFDQHTRVLIPLSLLGITPLENGEIVTKHSLSDDAAIVSYVQYSQAAAMLPKSYHDSVVRRWGVDMTIGSPLITVSVLMPEYVDAIEKGADQNQFPNDVKLPEIEVPEENQDVFMEPEVRIHGGDRYLIEKQRSRREKNFRKKLLYKNLSKSPLETPIRLHLWLNSNDTVFNERSNPQCVHWSTAKGFGEWSRVGCRTELDDNWYDETTDRPIMVNCSCNQLATFAVLVDVVDLEYIPEPSLLENISSYSCFAISLPLLLATYLILALIRGLQTNSNTIRKNLVLCVFLAESLFFVALKARRVMVAVEFTCKLVAIGMHYLWLAAFCWMLIDAVHLYRMLTEMRDINHGPMRFYYSIGYVVPAVVVGLSVGVRAHQYGNYYFCWVSLYESVIWSLVGPTCLLTLVNLIILVLCIRAAFTLQDHVLGFGNLRTLLWVSVIALPLLGATWVLAVITASERHPLLTPFLSVGVLLHAAFSLAGYCFANSRVRQNLLRTFMRCMGKKVPLLDTQSVVGVTAASNQNITIQSRSALAYHSSLDGKRRNIGISASSTTSRSTTKTSSSPYRSDTHLRHTSTSTSNYNSASDVPSYLRSFDHTASLRRRDVTENGELKEATRERHRGESDSDSDGSEGRSLDLASSHSSDDDESSTKRRHHRSHASARQGYLPNITEHVVSRCGTPPSLNVVTNSQLFPSVQPHYGSRWSSQLPESYLPNPNEIGRWSAETGSDNEILHKTNSPNPLPNPDVTGQTCLPSVESEQYMLRAHYNNHYSPDVCLKNDYMSKMIPHDNLNYPDYDRYSDLEEKHHLNEKYLFPYTDNITAEEDHMQHNYAPPNMIPSHPGSRVMSPITNELNNPHPLDYPHHVVPGMPGSRMGSRIGSHMGSLHGAGSACGSTRGSPPLMPPPVSMIHSGMPPEPSSWCWTYTVNK